jgi:hypothetical protein
MDASIFWDNPGLVLLGILAGIFLILLPPIIGAVRRSRQPRRDSSLRAREPSVYGDRYDDGRSGNDSYFADYDEERSSDRWNSRSGREQDLPAGAFGAGPRKRKPMRASVPVRSIWFAIGVCVGAGGLALWSNLSSFNPLTTVMAFFDPGPPPVADRTALASPDIKAEGRFDALQTDVAASPAAVGDSDEVGEMVAGFVTDLKARLPMAVGPGISMVNVDSKGNVVALGFTIAKSVGAEDAPKLQDELETRFRTSVCSTPPDPTNIHGLNERGVTFLISYVDLLGTNVAGLTVDPNFCQSAAP